MCCVRHYRSFLPLWRRTVTKRTRVLMRAGLERSADTIRAVADGGPLADSGVINAAGLRIAVDDYVAGRAPAHGPALWATVAVDSWLTHVGGGLQ